MTKTIKRKPGQPTKLTPEVLKLTQEYYKDCLKDNVMPYIGRLAIKLGVHRDTLNSWSNTDEKDNDKAELLTSFSDLLKKINNLIEVKLLENVTEGGKGMIGSMFRLKTTYGYIETSKQVVEDDRVVIKLDMGTGYQAPKTSLQPNLADIEETTNKLTSH